MVMFRNNQRMKTRKIHIKAKQLKNRMKVAKQRAIKHMTVKEDTEKYTL